MLGANLKRYRYVGTTTAAESKISKETIAVPQVSDKLASLDTAAVMGTHPDPLVYGPPGSGSITQEIRIRIRLWILPFSHKGVERTETILAK